MLVFFNQVTPRYTVPISLFVVLEFPVFRSSDILAFNEENVGKNCTWSIKPTLSFDQNKNTHSFPPPVEGSYETLNVLVVHISLRLIVFHSV